MTAHFEPQPLMQRVMDHWPMIGKSVFALIIIALVAFFPMFAIQQNVQSCWNVVDDQHGTDSSSSSSKQWTELGCLQYSWVVGTLPIILALFVWQIAVFRNNPTTSTMFRSQQALIEQLQSIEHYILYGGGGGGGDGEEEEDDIDQQQERIIQNVAQDTQVPLSVILLAKLRRYKGTLRRAFAMLGQLLTNLTPMSIATGVLLFAYYLETGNHWILIASMIPFIGIVLVLITLFAVDYAVGGSLADGVAFVGLGLACLAPLTAFVFPIRGLTGLPLVITFGATFVVYAQNTLKLLQTVDDLGAVA